MERLQKLEEKIKEGGMLTSEEALWLLEEAPFEELCEVGSPHYGGIRFTEV